ncbi:MAG: membrane protein insertion efficiency factor YidD [Bacteroidota bacterium]
MRLLPTIARLPRLAFISLVRLYQLVLSPHIGNACRFQPTCPGYSIRAFEKYGALKGLVLTVYRIARCHPWGGHGYDPPRWFGEPAGDDDIATERPLAGRPDGDVSPP